MSHPIYLANAIRDHRKALAKLEAYEAYLWTGQEERDESTLFNSEKELLAGLRANVAYFAHAVGKLATECPVCEGSGVDWRLREECSACEGTGRHASTHDARVRLFHEYSTEASRKLRETYETVGALISH